MNNVVTGNIILILRYADLVSKLSLSPAVINIRSVKKKLITIFFKSKGIL